VNSQRLGDVYGNIDELEQSIPPSQTHIWQVIKAEMLAFETHWQEHKYVLLTHMQCILNYHRKDRINARAKWHEIKLNPSLIIQYRNELTKKEQVHTCVSNTHPFQILASAACGVLAACASEKVTRRLCGALRLIVERICELRYFIAISGMQHVVRTIYISQFFFIFVIINYVV